MDRSTYDDGLNIGRYFESSTKTPNFHALKQQGVRLPVKSYSWQRYDIKDKYVQTYLGTKRQRDSFGQVLLVDSLRSGNIPLPGGSKATVQTLSNLQGTVTNRLLDKVRDQDIDLGVAMGEYRETASFFATSCVRIAKSYRSFRRGRVSEALSTLTGRKNNKWRDIPGVASDAWLAYSYALRPLLSDIHGAAKALSKRNKFVDVAVVRSTNLFDFRDKFVTAPSSWAYTAEMMGEVRTRGEIRFRVSNPLYRIFDQVGLTNPLSIAWELVPFSFVVDWLLPIGKTLANVVPPQGVDFVDGWVSQKTSGSSFCSTNLPTPGLGWKTLSSSREILKTRSVLTGFPRYHVVVPDLSLSKQQIASGLALLWQVSQGR